MRTFTSTICSRLPEYAYCQTSSFGLWTASDDSKKFQMDRTCLVQENSGCDSYNQKLVPFLAKIPASFPGSKLVYADIYTSFMDMVNDPQKHGKLKLFN